MPSAAVGIGRERDNDNETARNEKEWKDGGTA